MKVLLKMNHRFIRVVGLGDSDSLRIGFEEEEHCVNSDHFLSIVRVLTSLVE